MGGHGRPAAASGRTRSAGMRCHVLLRRDTGDHGVCLRVTRSADGHIACTEPGAEGHDGATPGMTWRQDGRYRLNLREGSPVRQRRKPPEQIPGPELAYAVPMETVLTRSLPAWTPDGEWATFEIDAARLGLDAKGSELCVELAPPGVEPDLPGPTAECLARWRSDDGVAPSIVISLYDLGEDSA